MTDRIGAFGNMDPNSFVAGASPLQQQAWGNVDKLADWQPQMRAASQLALQAGTQAPNYAGRPQTMGAPGLMESGGMAPQRMTGGEMKQPRDGLQESGGMVGMRRQPRTDVPTGTAGVDFKLMDSGGMQQGPAYGYNPATGQASGYQAPQLGSASLVQARGYDAPQLGPASGYAAPRVGAPIGASVTNYTAQPTAKTEIGQNTDANAYNYNAMQAGGSQIDPTVNAQAGSLLDNFQDYWSPFADDVVKTTMSSYDQNAAEQQARLMADGARNGAFGGSRFGVAQAELLGDQGRTRAELQADLRNQAFNTAAGLSQSDAANRQQASLFNAGSANQRGLAQAGLDQDRNFFNAANVNEQRQFGADAGNRASMFNAGNDLTRNLTQAGLNQDVNLTNSGAVNQQRQFGAGAANTAGLFNAGQDLQSKLAQAGFDAESGQFNAGARNQFGLAQAGFNQDAGQFNSGLNMQGQLANQGAQNQFGLAQAGLSADAGQFNAGAQNQFGLANMDARNQAGQFNAGANNQMSQFNAQQGDNAQLRALQAAGMLGGLANDYGQNTRSDLGLMNDFGGDMRAIEQMYAMAGPAQLEMMGQLYGTTPYNLFSGQNVNSSGTMTGTNTTVQKPSLFSMLMQMGEKAGTAATMGMG